MRTAFTDKETGVVYAPGAKFKVVSEGVYVSGMKPDHRWSNTWGGYREDLPVGTVIECNGFGPGWGSDPGYGIEWKIEGVDHVEVRPAIGGVWAYRPAPGLLEPVEE